MSQLVYRLVLKIVRYISIISGYFFYYLLPVRKKVVISNLKQANIKDIKKNAKLTYVHFINVFLEVILLRFCSRKFAEYLIQLEDVDLNKFIKNENKAVIFLTGHLGSWEVAAISGSINLGLQFNILAKKQSSSFSADFIKKVREKYGNKEIYTGLNMKELLRAIENKQVIAIAGDQRGARESITIKYFGRDTHIQTGVARIAVKRDVKIILSGAVKQKNLRYKPVYESLDYSNILSEDEKIKYIMQTYFEFLEKIIRQYPDQYFWMHNIWKY